MEAVANNLSFNDQILGRVTSKDKQYLEKNVTPPNEIVRRAHTGLPGSVLRYVVSHIPRSIIIDAIGTDATNLNKLFHKILSRSQTDTLDDVTALWYELRRFFNFDEDMLIEWINTSLPVLGGEKPVSLMISTAGRNLLRVYLDKMRHGDF